MLRSAFVVASVCLIFGASCLPNFGTTEVTISVEDGGFSPVDLDITAIHNVGSGVTLSTQKPAAVTIEPTYIGEMQLYGCFDLGTAANTDYCLSADLISASVVQVYFDVNHNGNLSDDGGPIVNEGSSLFGAAIDIPWTQLVAESPFTSDFTIWVYSGNLWGEPAERIMEHYSRTQLAGNVELAGIQYPAYLADRNTNDGDLTNDGVYIDVNKDGTIDDTTEWFASDQAVTILGNQYIFRIGW